MRAIRIKEDEFEKLSPLLELIMNLAFDCSFIVNKEGKLAHCADTIPLIFGIPYDEIIGARIKDLEEGSVFSESIQRGRIELNKIHMINGITCFVHTIPLFDPDEEYVGTFCGIVHRGMEKFRSILEDTSMDENSKIIQTLQPKTDTKCTFNDFIGVSPEILEVIRQSKKAAQFDYPVLIRGETGTGKELIASGIHAESSRGRELPFIKINCTAIPRELLESELFGHEKGSFTGAFTTKKGKFEIAGEGTILLDEIGDMELFLQSKILRVLEEREFERVGGNGLLPFQGRIIASTNRNLERMIKRGTFREDLYYRLSAVEIALPPVRNSKEDILLLIKYFMNKININIPFSPSAISILKNYNWPGNVRQIKNVVAKLSMIEDVHIFQADHVREILMPINHINRHAEEDVPDMTINNKKEDDSALEEYSNLEELSEIEKKHILEVLNKTNQNIAASARLLGISRNTMYNKINKYKINVKKVILR